MVTTFGWLGRGLVTLLVLMLGILYMRGLSRIPLDERPSSLHKVSYFLGLALLWVAIASRLETIVAQLFTARALQQLLITEPVPFLLLASNPYPVLKAGFGRKDFGRNPSNPTSIPFNISPHRLQTIIQITRPGFVWAMFVMLFWFWHDHTMIAATSQNGWVHVIEVVSLFTFASLYWWHIAASAPFLHKPLSPNVRILYAFLGILPIKLTGIIMLFSQETVVGGYRSDYAGEVMLQWGDGLQFADSSAGAILIWVIGGIMYALAVTALGSRALSVEEAKPELPENPLLNDSLWVPPGIGAGAKNRPN